MKATTAAVAVVAIQRLSPWPPSQRSGPFQTDGPLKCSWAARRGPMAVVPPAMP